MNWLRHLNETQPIAHAVAMLACVCVLGMAFGSLKFRGIGLGTAGVLFAGIVVGHFGQPVDPHTLDFVKEFGLLMFVFTIGLQLGPGFFAALRKQGMKLNLLAAAIVLLGAVAAPLAGWLGSSTARQCSAFTPAPHEHAFVRRRNADPQHAADISPDRLALPALAYAVAYPIAIVGIIATLLILKQIFRIDPEREAQEFAAKDRRQSSRSSAARCRHESRTSKACGSDAFPGASRRA